MKFYLVRMRLWNENYQDAAELHYIVAGQTYAEAAERVVRVGGSEMISYEIGECTDEDALEIPESLFNELWS